MCFSWIISSIIFTWCTLEYTKILQHQKVDVSEGIDVNKTRASKEYELCYYWLFKDVRFKFEEHVCNGCHYLLTMTWFINMAWCHDLLTSL